MKLDRREFVQRSTLAAAFFGLPLARAEEAFGQEAPPLPARELYATDPDRYWAELRRQWLLAADHINLNYSGNNTIAGLVVDGISQGPGVYGSTATNPDGAFAGVGTITVVPEPTTIGMVALGGSLLVGAMRFRRRLR